MNLWHHLHAETRKPNKDSERIIVDETDCLSIPPGVARRAFYQDEEDDTFTYALERIGPAPVRIFRDKATFTPTRFGMGAAHLHPLHDGHGNWL